ncbi:hypothetical protein [Trueperella pecoris]|uniref:hypothetical protein n=1 Tax=Trueperella pecoris TaxID=2733571 RepID=UPI001ABE037E|nr:hypothetical protein [Trueperella pecoris]QTG74863.1 hypothetical protein J4179_06415 [Trueperella pecoris]
MVVLDNGEANQGSPLNIVYHANRTADTTDPIASVFNHLKYDAVGVGNHEFNYGHLDKDGKAGALNQYRQSLNMPMLGTSVIVKDKGADVVVLSHTGMDAPGYVWKAGDLEENAATSIATQTAGATSSSPHTPTSRTRSTRN